MDTNPFNPYNDIYKNRARCIKAMDFIVKLLKNQEAVDDWKAVGVSDNIINEKTTLREIIEMGFCSDGVFAQTLYLFAFVMKKAINQNNWKNAICLDGLEEEKFFDAN